MKEDAINDLFLTRRLPPLHPRVSDSLDGPRQEEDASLPECLEDALDDTLSVVSNDTSMPMPSSSSLSSSLAAVAAVAATVYQKKTIIVVARGGGDGCRIHLFQHGKGGD